MYKTRKSHARQIGSCNNQPGSYVKPFNTYYYWQGKKDACQKMSTLTTPFHFTWGVDGAVPSGASVIVVSGVLPSVDEQDVRPIVTFGRDEVCEEAE